MKRVLIILPYFPPVNAADMQRVRMSLPYFKDYGWEAEVVTVDPVYAELPKDDLLVGSVPANIIVHRVKAFDKQWTSKLGFGNIAYRALWFYRAKVDQLLAKKRFDLIYFSTTQFAVCIMGAYWKRKFKVPYVIDMQDPWQSDYYQDKPKEQQPPKYWFSYRINKFLEPIAMKQVGGLISVSENYIETLKDRYPEIKQVPSATITFGAFRPDFDIALSNAARFKSVLKPGYKNMVYVGRGGMDMHNAIKPVFEVIKKGLEDTPASFEKLMLYFIGTSYAPNGEGVPTILPLARQYEIEEHVVEITDRIGYYHTLNTLSSADALFVPGSDDPKYTASKIYPYLLTGKPLLAIFNSHSSAINILREFGVPETYSYDATEGLQGIIEAFFNKMLIADFDKPAYNEATMEKYSARNMAKRQCELFNAVINEQV